ncbi:hypothetical protein BBBOND_0304220 [Babesia bigemina]|uniref:Uncharacterized protein n=1 Tax=Babesia bigemina TaxID=5866 RepID=A0A061D7J6_BABBI|nr:hypothetical protein BBBOND_0304220 [Babesia bigemina]CDR96518.1 hypothetical protein BBBOND_0304220 [Babesia bigemina]|eukprot:XP_012768704.1 hypothetical protein BBBOND_0304220 [Babesia bigemina]
MRDMKPKEDYDFVEDPQAQTGWMPAWMAPKTIGNGPTWNRQPTTGALGDNLVKFKTGPRHVTT